MKPWKDGNRHSVWWRAGAAVAGLAVAGGLRAAGESAPVTPAEVVSNAVAHSIALRAADQDAAAARAAARGARAARGPAVDLALQAMRYQGLEEAVLGPSIVIPAIEGRYGGSLTLTQPLFTGGRLTAEDAGARARAEAAEARRQVQERDAVLEALTAYWGWSKAYHAAEAMRAAVARMEEHAKNMRSMQDAGLATRSDALATDVLLDRTRLQLREAQRRDEVARVGLAFLTGRELPAGARPERAEPGPGEPGEEPARIAEALGSRLERVADRGNVEAAEAAVRRAKGAIYPQVSAIARYEQARPNSQFFPPEDEWNDDAFAGVMLQWNLLDCGLARSRVAEAAARRQQARLGAEHTDERIELEVREALIAQRNARDRLALAGKAEESAGQNVAVATDLWKSGLARNVDVLDAHARLTEAQYDVVAAAADAVLADALLRHALGREAMGDAR